MSYTSKFTEIFEISPDQVHLESVFCSPLPTTPELSVERVSKSSAVKPISIPMKRETPINTAPYSPHNNNNNSEALSYKFKTFLNSISRKRDRSVSPATSSKAIPIK